MCLSNRHTAVVSGADDVIHAPI